MLPEAAQEVVDEYLGVVDAVLPGRLDGFYVVGSAALGGFRPARSDVDFVAVLRDELRDAEIEALRRAQRGLYRRNVRQAFADVPWRWRWPRVANGVYVREGDLHRSSLAVTPVAGHVAGRFETGAGFDVNPVTWWTLAERGVTVRGPEAATLEIPRDDHELRSWTLDNLNTYWAQWAESVARPGRAGAAATVRHLWVWGVLGAPRLHYTVATGAITSKEGAGEYARESFDRRWHPLIGDALAYWRDPRGRGTYAPSFRRPGEAAAFVAMVVASANESVAARPSGSARRDASGERRPAGDASG